MICFEPLVLFTCLYLSYACTSLPSPQNPFHQIPNQLTPSPTDAIFYIYLQSYPLIFGGIYSFNRDSPVVLRRMGLPASMRKPWVLVSQSVILSPAGAGKGNDIYWFESSDFANAIIGWDVVHSHSTSLHKPNIRILLNALVRPVLCSEI